jgi:tripartite-type tricarboxylate transporter receptor subunit TctC
LRKQLVSLWAIAFALPVCGAAFTRAAFAQSDAYPNRLIKLIHQYTPGGGNDLIARIIAAGLSEHWHQSVIVEPRPGGGGIIGADAVAKAAPDGYTLLVTNVALSMLPALGKPLPFDVPASFAPIVIATTGQFVLVVSGDAPYRALADVVSRAAARPGQIPYSSVGVGSPHHLIMEMLKTRTGIDLLHVPYKGAAPQMQDIVAGQIQIGFSSVSSAIAQIKSGSVRPLVVSGDQRSVLLPDTPTVIESGIPDFVADSWYGVLAPAGTPKPVIDQDMTAVEGSDPASFAARIAKETRMWRDVVVRQGLKLE